MMTLYATESICINPEKHALFSPVVPNANQFQMKTEQTLINDSQVQTCIWR